MRKLLTNQRITSEGGWHVVRLANPTESYHWTGRDPEYDLVKKWCRQNCNGTYGYSRVELHQTGMILTPNQSVSYFVFKDEIDVFALKLLSYDLQHNAVWPAGTKFTMFVGDR